EFYRAFPHDVYDDEDDFRTREKEKRVFERRFDTAEDKTFTLKDMSGWAEGKYVAELTTEDKFGEEVKVVKYLSLYSLKDKAIPA
ncbi:hypothetical protein GWO43_28080, partial [candidate division KSB1 bacterium]|nr:hypothetical protein [candidate division KSB1 bacterium]NIS27795.1 hypothetical protein [candidate division KSB1 bacterium]NIT74649.1 hypothetical protein [candidate division KSB1 bacterium]NIU28462.1 hypothetical protein [candidate division KSB1 bacterium]NIU91723.1 hypothetical protein [candidate division KSB1 bacterium]